MITVRDIPGLEQGYLPVTYPTGLLWNPYLTTWPRAFPASLKQRRQEELSQSREQIAVKSVGMLQSLVLPSLATHSVSQGHMLALGLKTFSLTENSATVFTQQSLWSLLLPTSKSGCSAAVLRSFLSQPVMWRLGICLAVSASWVDSKQMSEEEDEIELPLELLLDLNLTCSNVKTCLTLLYSTLQTVSSCINQDDVTRLETWFSDLDSIDFTLPTIRRRKRIAHLTQGGGLSDSQSGKTPQIFCFLYSLGR